MMVVIFSFIDIEQGNLLKTLTVLKNHKCHLCVGLDIGLYVLWDSVTNKFFACCLFSKRYC